MTQVASLRAETAKLSKSSSRIVVTASPRTRKLLPPKASDVRKPFRRTSLGARADHEAASIFAFALVSGANPCFIRDARRYAARSRALIFIQIFAGNIILRHLMGAHFPLIVAPGVLHASYDFGLERVSFLD